MITLPDYERSVSTSATAELRSRVTLAFIEKREIFLRPEPFGDRGLSCVLAKNKFDAVLAMGFGKGTDWEIGSFGECVEHLHLNDLANTPEHYEILINTQDLIQTDVFFQVGHSLNKQSSPIRAIPHQVFGGERIVHVPTLMFGLRSSVENRTLQDHEVFFSRYSSSNGTAFGFNTNDALLHAILEVIERHEISKLFLNIIEDLAFDPTFVLINEYSLNPDVAEIADRLSGRGAIQPVLTLIKKNEFGAYFSFSYTRGIRQGKNTLIWGAGCSLFRDVAMYRSVAECEQSLDGDLPREDDQIFQLVERYPSFNKLINFGLGTKAFPKKYSSVESPMEMCVEDQLDFLRTQIESTGRTILFYEHESVTDCYRVVSVYITNTEKFFGIIFANPVLPISHLEKFLKNINKK